MPRTAGAGVAEDPVPLPADWAGHVNKAQSEAELERIGASVRKGCPYGGDEWVKATAIGIGLEYTLRPRGRPRRSRLPPAETDGLPFSE